MLRSSLLLLVVSVFAAGCNCGKKPAAPAQLLEGEPCENDERCVTGLCDAPPGFAPVCVRRCGDGCQPTEVCVQLTPNRFACQPDQRKLCQPCAADIDCPYPSDKCITVNTEKVCGRDCAFDQNCPTGYRCVNAVGVDGLPKVQQCVPIVASCACLARGDFEQACQAVNSVGTCTGLKKCDLVSNSVVCDARQAVVETCNGIDDDCDGDVDEGLMTAMCGVGACARSVSSCVDGGVANCVPGQPIAELCNGIDDDCDGTLDNGFDTTTTVQNCGACGRVCSLPHATPRCDVGVCRVLSCDTGWDNCNGLDPDGCESNVTADPMNCGACNAPCTRAHSTATCSNSTCSFVCAPGWVDLNGDPTDGCEYNCTFTSATDLPDLLFVDANCDGIDGELNNAIFVSPNGLDSNAGTRAAPMLTLAAAMSALTTTSKRDVYLAQGAYTGPLRLLGASGVNVAGAYHPTTWQRSFANQVTITGGNPGLEIDGANNVTVQAMRIDAANADTTNRSSYGGTIKESSTVKLESLDLRAGNGLAGAAGSAAGPATNGNPGTGGREGCYNDPRLSPTEVAIACNFDLFLPYCSSARPGGSGGTGGCGNGGAGGSPTRYSSSGTPSGGSGGPGLVSGGAGGQGVPAGITPSVGSIYWGADGTNGGAGTNGTAAGVGTLNNTGFVLASAQNGVGGTAGRGGGGGGGGAGGLGLPLGGIYAGISCYSYGSAGSGGGSAGCGGNPGVAGGSGGASIGLFLYNAQVTAQGTVVRSGNGGAGGAGGDGSSGGVGGSGGASAYDSAQGQATRAGGGGRGGNGGTGGHGGGGAGGSVYGIAKNTASTWSPTGGSVTLGTPGTGGTSLGNAGAAGATGVQTTFP